MPDPREDTSITLREVLVRPDTVQLPLDVVQLPHAYGILAMKNDASHAALRELYAEADRLLGGWTCPTSTECCRFGLTGREPYLWPIEWAYLERAIAARGGKKAVAKKKLHVMDGACPLLGADDRCSVYDARPFGCRTFFCSRATGPTRQPPRAELAAIARRIADLSERARPDGPRTLTSWLATS